MYSTVDCCLTITYLALSPGRRTTCNTVYTSSRLQLLQKSIVLSMHQVRRDNLGSGDVDVAAHWKQFAINYALDWNWCGSLHSAKYVLVTRMHVPVECKLTPIHIMAYIGTREIRWVGVFIKVVVWMCSSARYFIQNLIWDSDRTKHCKQCGLLLQMLVCWSHQRVLQKRLNRSIRHLAEADSYPWAKVPRIRSCQGHTRTPPGEYDFRQRGGMSPPLL